MFVFFTNWVKDKNKSQNKIIAKKKHELILELNEYSTVILTKKKQLEALILEKLEQQILLTGKNSFLLDLKKDIESLRKLDLGNKIDDSQLRCEISYLENILTVRFDELDKRELKLCAYFRLGFNSKEIAVIENIDLNEVRFYKIAIRRKLKLKHSISLRDYLVFEE